MLGTDRDERIDDAQVDNSQKLMAPLDSGSIAAEAVLAFNDLPAGSAYGTLLHDLLEWQFEHGWPIAAASPSLAMTSEWDAMLGRKTQRLKLDEAQSKLLGEWVKQLVQAALVVPGVSKDGKPLILSQLDSGSAWAEMAFTLQVHKLSASRVDSMIGQHVLAGQTRQPLQPLQLEGMLVGFMDLVLEHEGKYFVLDYKSNRLPSYGAESLQSAILAHRYDVQYTLYVLALHRLLKSRIADYDYDQYVGGAIYWFLRGIDQPGAGVFADKPPKALIEALDHAFSQNVYTPAVAP